MICYRDMTFCKESTCSNFGDGIDDCPRSLTLAVQHMASHWWHSGREQTETAPVCVFTDRPDCYEVKK